MTSDPLPLTIRPARHDDEAFLVNLLPRLADFPLPRWRTADEIARGDRAILLDALHGKVEHSAILVAEFSPGGERAGYVFATTKHDYFTRAAHAHVEVIAVTPEAERRGVARALMAAIEQWAGRRGYRHVTLNVFDRNTRAKTLYDSLGYEAETIHFRKDLSPMATSKPASAPQTFRTPEAFRAWLARHHATATELDLRLFKVHAAHRGLTYAQALDEALCFGWIDGVVHRLDEDSFRQRYTPRQARSTWSRRNMAHVGRLRQAGRMTPAGLAAYEARAADRSGVYSFEQERPELAPPYVKAIRANKAAWVFFQGQAPGFRRLMAHWIMSAKKDETRATRLAMLIDCSARGRKIPPLEALSAKRPRQG